ncbi:MAG TPA: multidrug effflux MFS transporter, partial [Acetobacteraceae bacterium]|nr:multidrug effflux MFS transporter [Acetobacteraceae bacterium]
MPFPTWLPILLGFLTAVGPISTDMYLPAFPAIDAEVAGVTGAAQITLATWFLGLAVGQMTQGTLSDRYGRRWPLMAGTAVYALASAGCALSPNLAVLAICRFFAGVGGSAGMVIPRAVVRDLADGHAAARLLSRLMLVMGAAPILAPTMGSLVLSVADWRTIFWIGAVFGALCCVLVLILLPDTLPPNRRLKLGVAAQLTRWGGIIVERGFITNVLLGGFSMFGMFAFLGGSPSVFIEHFHLAPSFYGAIFGCSACGLIVASQLNPILLGRFGPNRMLHASTRTMLTACIVLTVVAFSGSGSWIAVAAPIAVAMSCQGFTGPNATVAALSRHGATAGSASALMGTIQFVLGAVSGVLVGELADGTARPMALLMLFGAVGAAICDLCRPKPK